MKVSGLCALLALAFLASADPMSNFDTKELTGVCRQCEQFVAGYYAWRFREPLSTWAYEWPEGDPELYSRERAEKEKFHWPVSREFVCGYWARNLDRKPGYPEQKQQQQSLQRSDFETVLTGKSRAGVREHREHTLEELVDPNTRSSLASPSPRMAKRRQICDKFYDHFINPENQNQLDDRLNALRYGCIQGMADQCPRKWMGMCSPRVACNCLTGNACGDILGPNSHCLAPCKNLSCSNCETELDKGVTSGKFSKCPSGSFCSVSQSLLGLNFDPTA